MCVFQAFARFSAVFGGVYALGETITSLLADEEGNFSQLILGNGQKMSGKFCVLSPNFSTERLRAVGDMAVNVSHSVYLTEASIKEKYVTKYGSDFSRNWIVYVAVNSPSKTIYVIWMIVKLTLYRHSRSTQVGSQ